MMVGPKTYFKYDAFVNGKYGNADPPIVSLLVGSRRLYFRENGKDLTGMCTVYLTLEHMAT